MIQQDKIISKSLFAGIVISIFCYILLSCNTAYNDFLFPIALLFCSIFGLNLYTTKICTLSDTQDIRRSFLVLILNLFAVIILGLLFSLDDNIYNNANIIINKKFNIGIIDTIIGATITGFIMPLLIWDDNRTFNVIKMILFVVLGSILFTSIYQHTVFDLFIYVSSLRMFTDPGDTFIRLLFTVIFNFIGCNMYNIIVNKSLVYNKNSIL